MYIVKKSYDLIRGNTGGGGGGTGGGGTPSDPPNLN